MSGPNAQMLPDGRRLHLHHGPIDLIIRADGPPTEVQVAYDQAIRFFQTVLQDLVDLNCEPALCTVLFMGGAGGSLRSGVTENPVELTLSVQGKITHVTCGGAPVYVWPGGGITLMVDVTKLPDGAFGYVPTPALVAPIEFTLSRDAYRALGGHDGAVRSLDDVLAEGGEYGSDSRLPSGNI